MTPTAELVLEVLAARTRLEEPFWTFSTRHMRALRELEAAGLVNIDSAPTEHAVQVALTDSGRAAALHPGYRSRWERLSYWHADDTPCDHGWRHATGECYAGCGPVTPRLED